MLKVIGFDGSSIETTLRERKKFKWVWVDIFNPTQEEMEEVSREFSIPLDELRDIMELEDVPRVEKDGRTMRVFFRIPFAEDIVSTIAIVVGENYVISFHEEKAVPVRRVYSRARRAPVRSPKDLMIKLLENSVRHFERLDELAEKHLDRLEESIISGKDANISSLYLWRERIGELYRALLLNKSAISELLKTKQFRQGQMEKLDELYYDIIQLIDFFSSHKESVVNLIELHMNMQNIKMQEIMKFLAAITFIAAIPTVISSIYGMNFRHLPMSDNPYGFWISIVAMLVLVLISLLYFKKRRWI